MDNRKLQTYNSVNDALLSAKNTSAIIVTYENNVYDLTEFQDKHPGGGEAIKGYQGKQIDNILFNEMIHKHSQSALKKMEQYKIGVVQPNPTSSSQDQVTSTSSNINNAVKSSSSLNLPPDSATKHSNGTKSIPNMNPSESSNQTKDTDKQTNQTNANASSNNGKQIEQQKSSNNISAPENNYIKADTTQLKSSVSTQGTKQQTEQKKSNSVDNQQIQQGNQQVANVKSFLMNAEQDIKPSTIEVDLKPKHLNSLSADDDDDDYTVSDENSIQLVPIFKSTVFSKLRQQKPDDK